MNWILSLLGGAAVSWLTGWLLIRFEGLHAHFSHDFTASGPQKFHSMPTPRIGGIPIAAGYLTSAWMACTWAGADADLFIAFSLSLLPAFASGLVEDLTKRIGPDMRLWASFLSALVAVYFFDSVVDQSGIAPVDALLAWYPLALVFTAVGIGGVAHAMNIIDGYNGLASIVGCLMLAALGTVAWQVQDVFLAALCAAIASGTLGFFVWNFPNGRIFAGDGGAYLWGVSIAVISVLLINRNPAVSPWFPLAVVIYPVFETLFSIYRRTIKHSAAAGQPDAKHLHQLVFRRLIRRPAKHAAASARLRTHLNSGTSIVLWGLAALSIVPATLFWQSTATLAAIAFGFCAVYVWLYRSIVRFETPRFLRTVGAALARIAVRYNAGPAP